VTLRCVIVDDSPGVLRAATELLEIQGLAVVGVAATSEEALSLVEELEPDVVLVDIDLGPYSGFELARRLSQCLDTTSSRVILTSTHEQVDYANLIAASPAIGFLPKSDLSANAIRELLAQAREQGR
jgi:DNA-binding NarL/FixJ family response regulator